MSINMFFLNLRKKHLLKKISRLKKEASKTNLSIKSSNQTIDNIDAIINNWQKRADNGDEDSLYSLNLHRDELFKIRAASQKVCDELSQIFFNTSNEISCLEEELSNLTI